MAEENPVEMKEEVPEVETDVNGDAEGDSLNGDQIGEDEEGERIILGGASYPREGTDRDYKYEELLDRVFSRSCWRLALNSDEATTSS